MVLPEPFVLTSYNFNPYSLLSLISIIVNFGLLIFIASKGTSASVNRWFILVLASLTFWATAEFFARNSPNPSVYIFWEAVDTPGWIFVGALYFGFAMSFVGKEAFVNNIFTKMGLFFVSFVLMILTFTTDLFLHHDPSKVMPAQWGWVQRLPTTFSIALFWVDALLVVSVIFLIIFFFKTRNPAKKNQTAWFVLATLIPIIGGSLTNGIAPLVLKNPILPTAVILTAVMSSMIAYAIARYKLFVLNPALAIAAVMEAMAESLIVVDMDLEIQFVNKAGLDLLKYDKSELPGKKINQVIADVDWKNFSLKVVNALSIYPQIKDFELKMVAKTGEIIPVSLSVSKLIENGDQIGIVCVITDIRLAKQLVQSLTAEKNKMDVALSGIADGVFGVDLAGEVTFFNPGCEKILGITSNFALGRYVDEIIGIYDQNNFRISIRDLLPKEESRAEKIIKEIKGGKIRLPNRKEVMVDIRSSTIPQARSVNLGAIITLHAVNTLKP